MNTRMRHLIRGMALLTALLVGAWGVKACRQDQAPAQGAADRQAWSFDPFRLRPDHDQSASGQPHIALHDPVHWGRSDKSE